MWGLTVSEQPTLWFYVPYQLSSELPIEFVLSDEGENYVYKTSFTLALTRPGIVKLKLPPTVTLETGKLYHWYFLINCQPDVEVNGWIQRIAVNGALADRLQNATPRERVALYAKEGIWYDALTTLAQQRIVNPQDPSLMNDSISLLQSVELEAIAPESIVDN